jgi:hypothetical protein
MSNIQKTHCPDANCRGHKEEAPLQATHCPYCGSTLDWYCGSCQKFHNLEFHHSGYCYQEDGPLEQNCHKEIEEAFDLYYRKVYTKRLSPEILAAFFLVLFPSLYILLLLFSMRFGISPAEGTYTVVFCLSAICLFWKIDKNHTVCKKEFEKNYPQEKILIDLYWTEPLSGF